jgi:hypothetical protein
MTHLTTKQILQLVDGTLDYASQAQCTSHLAVCEQCRKEVGLQKAISKVAHHQPLIRTSAGFVQTVMRRVVPAHQKSWKTKVVDNLGNIFAMAMVLTVLGYAISSPSLFKMQEEPSQPSVVTQTISDTYAKFVQTFSQRANDATQKLVSSSSTEGSKIVSMTLISLLILAGLDQFVFKRITGIKMKH